MSLFLFFGSFFPPLCLRRRPWGSPEESLVQMARSHREDVDHVVLRLLLLLHRRAAGESPQSHKENFFFFLVVLFVFSGELCERLAGMALKSESTNLVRDFQKPVSFSSVPSLSSSSFCLSGFFWTWTGQKKKRIVEYYFKPAWFKKEQILIIILILTH